MSRRKMFTIAILLGAALGAPGALATRSAAAEDAPAAAPADRALSLDDAIAMALARNEAIVVERESVEAARGASLRARGAYDPVLDIQGDYRRATQPVNSPFSGAPSGVFSPTVETGETLLTLRQLFATGASAALHVDASRVTTNSEFVLLTPSWSTRVGVEVRQPLLRGRSIDPARLGLRVAAADHARSTASLRREVSETIAAVESAYWTLASSRRAVEVREEAVKLADQQLTQTRDRVGEGAAPETEVSQPLAELERRRGELYAARETVSRDENALKRLVLGAADTGAWTARFVPADDPNVEPESAGAGDMGAMLDRALGQRPELAESKAEVERRRLESDFARDTMKPGLDAFASYDLLGLAGTVQPLDPNAVFVVTVPDWIQGGLGRSFATMGEGRFADGRVGVQLSIPIGNRFARGDAAVAQAVQRQAQAGLDGIRKQILAEVLDAAAAVDTTAQRVQAARAARAAAEVQLSSEQDRYAVGLSTNFLVLTRQNDLSRARLDEIAAMTDYRKARTEMARATGSILDDRHIQVDEGGEEPAGREGAGGPAGPGGPAGYGGNSR